MVIEKTPELNLSQPKVEIQARDGGACCVKGKRGGRGEALVAGKNNFEIFVNLKDFLK